LNDELLQQHVKKIMEREKILAGVINDYASRKEKVK
jgi:hypothetical protein